MFAVLLKKSVFTSGCGAQGNFTEYCGKIFFHSVRDPRSCFNCHSTVSIVLFFVSYRYCSIGVFSAQFPLTVAKQVKKVDVFEAAAAAAATSEVNVAEKEPQTISESPCAVSLDAQVDLERICTFQVLGLFDRNGQRSYMR